MIQELDSVGHLNTIHRMGWSQLLLSSLSKHYRKTLKCWRVTVTRKSMIHWLLQISSIRPRFHCNDIAHCCQYIKSINPKNSYNRRLLRCIDRLLTYSFTNEHMPGAKMGLFEYFLDIFLQKPKKSLNMINLFLVATISTIRQSFKQIIKFNFLVLQRFSNISQSNLRTQNSNIVVSPQSPLTKTVKLQPKIIQQYRIY